MRLCPENFAGGIAFYERRDIFDLRSPASGCLGPFDISDASLPVSQNPEGFPMRAPLRWKRSEVIRAARAVQESGLHVRNVEVAPDGTIRINIIGEPSPIDPATATTINPWDEALNNAADQKRPT